MARFVALASALVVSASLAHADEWTDCNDDAPDRAIQGCSVIIQNSNVTVKRLAEAHFKRGSAYLRIGKLDQAIADLDAAIRLQPDYMEAYLSRSQSHSKRGEHDKATVDIRKAGSIQAERTKALIKRWQPRMEKRRQIGVVGVPITDEQDGCFADSEHAIRECSLIIERAGATPKQLAEAHFTRGVAHHLKLEFGRAIADYGQTILLSPDHALAYINRCSANCKIGKFDQAIMDCHEAIRLTPNDHAAYLFRGFAYQQKGMPDRAKADRDKWQSLAKAESDRLRADNDLFTVMVIVEGTLRGVIAKFEVENDEAAQDCAAHDPDRAIRGCASIIERRLVPAPELGLIHAKRGLAYKRKQELERAIAEFDEAIRLAPNGFEGYYLRGRVYERKGERERAIADYRRSLLLDSGSDRAKRGLARLGATP
jgi:tetratricopeptide (TPR) repeat protein